MRRAARALRAAPVAMLSPEAGRQRHEPMLAAAARGRPAESTDRVADSNGSAKTALVRGADAFPALPPEGSAADEGSLRALGGDRQREEQPVADDQIRASAELLGRFVKRPNHRFIESSFEAGPVSAVARPLIRLEPLARGGGSTVF
ncbi:MAG: hypothetical protein JW751_12580 [Polyangiaceae bacterium]|nr:hypothetical protein [Polyangiaceae bacterium]